MITSRKCKECIRAQRPPDGAVLIGDTVIVETPVKRGYDQTSYAFSQCTTCGSVWVTYRDSGAGGQGTFHRCLTATLF